MPSGFSTTPMSAHPSTMFGAVAPRSSMFAMPDNDKLQRLQDKNKKKSMKKINKCMGESSPDMVGTQRDYRNITRLEQAAA